MTFQGYDLTPEMQLGIELESIFMPYTRRQRDELYRTSGTIDKSVRFVHYTSAETALNIINSKRLWMRNTNCMSDYREVQHGLDFFVKLFSDAANTAKKEAFMSALDMCVHGAATEAITLFDQWLQNTRFNTYITSISEHDKKEDSHGRLSMWRAFGGNTARVALVFNIPWVSSFTQTLNILFNPVAYLTEDESYAMIDEVVKNIRAKCDFLRSLDRQTIIHTVFTMFLVGITCLKHEGFREEREWRAIYFPQLRPSALMESSTEVVVGVPQIVYKMPLDKSHSPALAGFDFAEIFDRLIIGPSQYPWPMYEAFNEALIKAGVSTDKQRIYPSGIPIRT